MPYNFSLVLPCYNEEKNIFFLYKEFIEINFNNEKIELIFVNNGSADNTDEEIEKVIKLHALSNKKNIHIKKIFLKTNQNYSGGVIAGLLRAEGNFIGWSHADLQTPLKDFYDIYLMIKDHNEILGKGKRINRQPLDQFITTLHELFSKIILGVEMKEINAAPKIFNKKMMGIFNQLPHESTLLDTYLVFRCLKKKIKIFEMDVDFKARQHGKSKWKNNFFNLFKHLIINFLYLLKLRFTYDNN